MCIQLRRSRQSRHFKNDTTIAVSFFSVTKVFDAIVLPVNPIFPIGIPPQMHIGQPVEFTGLVGILIHQPVFCQLIEVLTTVLIQRNRSFQDPNRCIGGPLRQKLPALFDQCLGRQDLRVVGLWGLWHRWFSGRKRRRRGLFIGDADFGFRHAAEQKQAAEQAEDKALKLNGCR
jgi:hypothetical protein